MPNVLRSLVVVWEFIKSNLGIFRTAPSFPGGWW